MNKIEADSTGISTPSISIIMSAYNAEDCIFEIIESILSQVFHDFELMVIDNGSTDNNVKIAEPYYDSRIILQKDRA